MRYADLPPEERSSDEPCQLCGHEWIHHTATVGDETYERAPGVWLPVLTPAPCDQTADGDTCCDAYPECACPGKCGCPLFVSSEEDAEARIEVSR